MIILVDDDKDILETNLMSLKNKYGREMLGDVHVVTFLDPLHALSFVKDIQSEARKVRIDLVVTDYNMLGMNGVQLASEIRKIFPLMPIVFYSSDEKEGMVEFKNSSYLKKGTVSYRDLIDIINYHLVKGM
jgi:CheY-like chemotaxis protein